MTGYAKAIAAFVVGALSVAWMAAAPDPETGVVVVTAQEWIGIILGALGSPAMVYATPNKPTDP